MLKCRNVTRLVRMFSGYEAYLIVSTNNCINQFWLTVIRLSVIPNENLIICFLRHISVIWGGCVNVTAYCLGCNTNITDLAHVHCTKNRNKLYPTLRTNVMSPHTFCKNWNVRTAIRSEENAGATAKKVQLKRFRTCRDVLWRHVHSQSWIKFSDNDSTTILVGFIICKHLHNSICCIHI